MTVNLAFLTTGSFLYIQLSQVYTTKSYLSIGLLVIIDKGTFKRKFFEHALSIINLEL